MPPSGLDAGPSIAHAIEQRSDEVLQVEYGSLYPVLHRLEDRGWIASDAARAATLRIHSA